MQATAVGAGVQRDSLAVKLPSTLDVSDLCSWIDSRLKPGPGATRALLRESIFMAVEDDDAATLHTVLERPGVEAMFEQASAWRFAVVCACAWCVCVGYLAAFSLFDGRTDMLDVHFGWIQAAVRRRAMRQFAVHCCSVVSPSPRCCVAPSVPVQTGGAINVLNVRHESPLIVAATRNRLDSLREILRRGRFQPPPLNTYIAKVRTVLCTCMHAYRYLHTYLHDL